VINNYKKIQKSQKRINEYKKDQKNNKKEQTLTLTMMTYKNKV